MPQSNLSDLFAPTQWFAQGAGPRYQQLYRHMKTAIDSGAVASDTLLPPEREIAEKAEVSRVTVRKAIGALAEDGLIRQRQGSGTYVQAIDTPRLKQSLSTLVSFTETMSMRGYNSSSRLLEAGLFPPTPGETVALGIEGAARIARIRRLRIADPGAMAIEVSSVPEDILPDPGTVDQSLYEALRNTGSAPVRAIQRIAAVNLSDAEAALLNVASGAAFLKIERTGYLANGRPVEFTTGVYRSDIYDFVAEVRLEESV